MIRQTHTFATLAVSKAAYEEIKQKLLAAGYQHAIFESDNQEVIDMHGIALVVEPVEPKE